MNLPQLTFTRFIAAMVIVIYHFGIDPNRPVFPLQTPVLYNILDGGNLGVSYFYVLSGFVMIIAYFESKTFGAIKYWLLRLARVYPVHLVTLAFLFFFLRDYFNSYYSAASISSQLTLTQAWFRAFRHGFNWPAWSLSVEIFFYFSFPFVLFLAKRIDFKWFAILTAAVWFASITFQFSFYDDHFEHLPLPLNHYSSFLTGICTGIYFKKNIEKLMSLSQSRASLIVLISMGIILGFAAIHHFEIRNYGLLAPVFGVLIVGISLSKSSLMKTFSEPFFVMLGEISFGIYMIHWPLWIWWERHITQKISSNSVNFWFYIIALWVVSYVSYQILENPARLWMKKKLG
jgi:peptidoglycan/LPS O-acetylase OafA/YrhL